MAKKGGSRRDGILIEALDPVTGGVCEVFISHRRLLTVGRRSIGHAKECGHLVPFVLQHPASVFEGLRRDEEEDPRGVGWRCYCAVPTCSYRRDGAEANPYPGQVYLVFINDERVAYNWRWDDADQDEPTFPIEYLTRFKRRLLPAPGE